MGILDDTADVHSILDRMTKRERERKGHETFNAIMDSK